MVLEPNVNSSEPVSSLLPNAKEKFEAELTTLPISKAGSGEDGVGILDLASMLVDAFAIFMGTSGSVSPEALDSSVDGLLYNESEYVSSPSSSSSIPCMVSDFIWSPADLSTKVN